MPLGPGLLDAYRKADYVVYGEPELVFHVGEPSAALDELLEAEGAETAAFITAANPRGELAGETANMVGIAALSNLGESYDTFSGEGRDPEGKWPAERSLLVVGIPLDEAARIGRAFDQNAIVFIEKGKPPELVVLGNSGSE